MTAEGTSCARAWSRRDFLLGVGAFALGAPSVSAWATPSIVWPGSVLTIGDSMALCGFGADLDERFRKAGVPLVYTYMACGTQPLSWTKIKPYTQAQSLCGFWKIESNGEGVPAVFKDVYGMTRGHRPGKHPVPKIEELLPLVHPDIVVVQLGNNLFELLKAGVGPQSARTLATYIEPFLGKIAEEARVKRVYWVGPPRCGRVAAAAHDFFLAQLAAQPWPWLRVIDSRSLIQWPYKNLQPDMQHFFGADMEAWASGVFAAIEKDLEENPLGAPPRAPAQAPAPPPPPPPPKPLRIKGRLVGMLAPYSNEEIAPYRDSLVAFVYEVKRVERGEFKDTHFVVLHAAHIAGKRQPMMGYFLNQTRTFNLIPVDATPYATLKSKEDPRYYELERFLTDSDFAKLGKQL